MAEIRRNMTDKLKKKIENTIKTLEVAKSEMPMDYQLAFDTAIKALKFTDEVVESTKNCEGVERILELCEEWFKEDQMKVTGWTGWDDETYPDIFELWFIEYDRDTAFALLDEVQSVIADCLRENGYKFCGASHQEHPKGCPVIDGKYKFCTSRRSWGDIMAKAYPEDVSDEKAGYEYVVWYFSPRFMGTDKDGNYIFEEEIFPE